MSRERKNDQMNSPDPKKQLGESRFDAGTDVDLKGRLAFLELTEADAQRLRETAPLFEEFADRFVDEFYNHLLRFQETARLLEDPERLMRLKAAQRAHLQSLWEANWSDAYVADRHRIGQAHAEVGLDPQWFLGAYNQYAQHCLRHLVEEAGSDAQHITDRLLPLMKVIFLDVGLTLDAYFTQATKKLWAALDMYWKANDELRRFAQLTSHDLKTPLATIANLCEEAIDEFGDQMPAEARELIKSAREHAFKNSTMIDELLETTLNYQSGDLRVKVCSEEVIREAIDRLRPVIREKEIDVQLPESMPVIWGNKARLREAFYNLLSNATKFIDKKPGKIAVSIEEQERHCVISIEDNGPGIPESELQRIFVPFRRLAEHRDRPGTGLGLYFTLHLIDHEGGQVWAESEPGAGSRFCVSLERPPPDD